MNPPGGRSVSVVSPARSQAASTLAHIASSAESAASVAGVKASDGRGCPEAAPFDASAKRITLPIDEAMRDKWEEGAQKYGPVFKTNALEELDEELLDSLNYCDEAERQGYSQGHIAYIRERLRHLCEYSRILHANGPSRRF